MHGYTRLVLGGMCAAGIALAALAADPKPSTKSTDIFESAGGMTDVSKLVVAIKDADLQEAFKGKGPFTLFAPTNDAFSKLGKQKVDDLRKPENKEKLKGILLYHVHAGDAIKAKDVKTMKLSTAAGQGKDLDVKVDGGTVWINGAKVVETEVICSNGVIHRIDTVVMPPG